MSVNSKGKRYCDCEVCDNMTEAAALMHPRSTRAARTIATGVHHTPTGLKTQRIVT
jgi:hypothetical protein